MDRGKEGYRPAGEEIRPEIEDSSLPEAAEQVLLDHDKEKVLEVARDLDPKYHSEFAFQVIRKFNDSFLVQNLFQVLEGLDAKVSLACRRTGMLPIVGQNIDRFIAIDPRVTQGLGMYGSKEAKRNLFESIGRLGLDETKLVEGLLDAGRGTVVLENKDQLSEISLEQLTEMFVEANGVEVLLVNLPRHPEFDQKMVVEKVLESPYAEIVKLIFDDIDKFDQLDHNQLVEDVLEATEVQDEDDMDAEISKDQKRKVLFDNLRKLNGLSSETADRLLATGDYQPNSLLRDSKSFENLDMEQLESQLRDENRLDLIVQRVDMFPHIDKVALADELRESNPRLLLKSLHKFPEADQAALADELIADGKERLFFEYARNFDQFSENAVDQLWEKNQWTAFAYSLDKMSNVPAERGLKLVELGYITKVVSNIQSINPDGHHDIIEKVLEKDPGVVAGCIGEITKLTPEQGYRLVETGFGRAVVEHLDKVPGIDQNTVARRLIQIGLSNVLFENLDKIQVDDWNKWLPEVIKKGEAEEMMKHLGQMQGVDRKALLAVLFNEREYHVIGDHVDKFDSSDHQDIALQMIREDFAGDFTRNIERFKNLDWQELIEENIEVMVGVVWFIPVDVIESLSGKKQERLSLVLDAEVPDMLYGAQYEKMLPYIQAGLAKIEIPGLSKEQVQEHVNKTLKNLQKKGLKHMAAQLAECAVSSGLEVDEHELDVLRKASEEEQERREKRTELREVDLGQHEVADEMTRFYVYQLIMSHLPAERLNYQQWGIELPHRDRVALNDITREAKPFNHELFEWMRNYGVHAVVSELRHQHGKLNKIDFKDFLHLPKMDVPGWDQSAPDEDNVDVFLRYATEQEIGEFLHQASIVFRKEGWHAVYGGEPWAKIAETVAEAWEEKYPEEVTCDRFFDLEHNSGMIFDKRPDRIRAESHELREILDFKFKAKGGADEWLAKLPQLAINTQTKRSLTGVLKNFKRMEPAIKKLHSKYAGQFS